MFSTLIGSDGRYNYRYQINKIMISDVINVIYLFLDITKSSDNDQLL